MVYWGFIGLGNRGLPVHLRYFILILSGFCLHMYTRLGERVCAVMI